jgi:hypothetical protein
VIPAEIQTVVLALVTALLSSTGFLLALFVGFCFFAGLSKLRPTGPASAVARNLNELTNVDFDYLLPDAPSGPADQLRTPELLEQADRKH